MESNSARTHGKSKSWPRFQSEIKNEAGHTYVKGQSWEEALRDLQRSPGYQRSPGFRLLSDSTASPFTFLRIAADGPSLDPSSSTDDDQGTEMGSPRSDNTVKPGDLLEDGGVSLVSERQDYEGSDPNATTLLGPGTGHEESLVHDGLAPQLNAHASVSQPLVPSGNNFATGRDDTPYEIFAASCAAYSDLHEPIKGNLQPDGLFVSSLKSAIASFEPETLGVSSTTNIAPNMNYSSARGTARGIAQNTPEAQGNTHYRRVSSNLSFVPVVPSPLGPARDLGSNVSGLRSPGPMPVPSVQQHSSKRNIAPAPKTAGLQVPPRIPSSWTQNSPGCYSPFDMSPSNDPFLERHPSVEQSSSTYIPPQRRTPTQASPQARQFSQPDLRHPVTGLSIYDNKPIPPPALPIGESRRVAKPASQTRLDEKKALREEWIKNGARKIVALAHTVTALKQKYLITRRYEDLNAWVEAQTEYENATNLELVTEDRRNLLLPEGMRALKAGPGTLPEDAMGGKAGGLLGHKMAVMEKICAEAVTKEDNYKMSTDLMTDSEKKATRKAVVFDVRNATNRRLERMRRGPEEGEGSGQAADPTRPVNHQP